MGDRLRRVGNLFKKPFKGARLPTWLREAPEWYALVALGLSPLLGLPIFETHGRAKEIWTALAVLAFLIGWGLFWARSVGTRSKGDWLETTRAEHQQEIEALATAHKKRLEQVEQRYKEFIDSLIQGRDRAVKRLEHEHKDALQNILHEVLYTALVVVVEALSEEDPTQRVIMAGRARKTIVCTAAKIVGKATAKTRANLFMLAPDRQSMTLENGMWDGRHDQSTRVFTAHDKNTDVFNVTMANKAKFVDKVSDEIIAEEGLVYRTYLTHPVSSGVNNIYGVLTVDSLHEGDLDRVQDISLAAVLSALIALTYTCEPGQGPAESTP